MIKKQNQDHRKANKLNPRSTFPTCIIIKIFKYPNISLFFRHFLENVVIEHFGKSFKFFTFLLSQVPCQRSRFWTWRNQHVWQSGKIDSQSFRNKSSWCLGHPHNESYSWNDGSNGSRDQFCWFYSERLGRMRYVELSQLVAFGALSYWKGKPLFVKFVRYSMKVLGDITLHMRD